MCSVHGGSGTRVASWDATPPPTPTAPRIAPTSPGGWRAAQQRPPEATPSIENQHPPDQTQKKDRKGILGRIRDIFK